METLTGSGYVLSVAVADGMVTVAYGRPESVDVVMFSGQKIVGGSMSVEKSHEDLNVLPN